MTGYSVVVVDDEPHVVETLSQLIESAGHRVVGKACSAEEAMRLNQTMSPDIIVLDLVMPGTSGLEAARQIMATRPVAIVVCTAYHDDDSVLSATSAGVYAYVCKPCSQADLLCAMQVAISRFRDAEDLKGETDRLKDALETRKLIEQAKGIVMQTRKLSEDEAYRFLQRESRRQSRSLAELAQAVITAERALAPNANSSE